MSDFFTKERSESINLDIQETILQRIPVKDLVLIIKEYAELTTDAIHKSIQDVIRDIFFFNSEYLEKYLLDKSIMNLEYILGMTPWSIILEIKHWEGDIYGLVKALIKDTDINLTNSKGQILLSQVVDRTLAISSKEKILTILIENKANVNQCDVFGENALSIAVKKAQPPIVKFLLDKGANIFNEDGISPYDVVHDLMKEQHSPLTMDELEVISKYFEDCFEEQWFRKEERKQQEHSNRKEKTKREREMMEKQEQKLEQEKKDILDLYERKKKQVELEKQLQEMEQRKAEELREQVIREALNNVDDQAWDDDSGSWD